MIYYMLFSKTYSRRFVLNLKGLSDGKVVLSDDKVVSLTKKKHGSAACFL